MYSGKRITRAMGTRFPEGLLVGIAEDLEPSPGIPNIIGIMALATIGRVCGEPVCLSGPISILISDEPSSHPSECQWSMNPEAGQVIIHLPENGRSSVKQLNAGLLQTAAAGALSVELALRATGLLCDQDYQAFAATGIRVSGELLTEANERLRRNTGGGAQLDLLKDGPEITFYSPVAVFGNPRLPGKNS